ncbi:hypothetical protein A8924_3499 [Saccharopolyspora erythraea NRRL 2338]|uniref:Uncharacterized protein n=2 Tax=Saccharopolyspora erythraea TaxID=1836 RepID=A4FEA9_SACEN|nr:hypothetical protein [Saccharopolyspora erythraea]EQD81520.1 hypothetical protein N599_35720 [Saccharopolyspora erythraea D]PFG96111.1 hypothetical protein A8924_3499 [Saccharopolyspora erythraea NRRL 2338]QRK92650.1 hypothetical protein JQX30_15940 [Saccharopolyspora erythraea]CAM02384.1 hypothetical protein SACE_3106 [Saccharopolyspora erythraea NRRL 2338]
MNRQPPPGYRAHRWVLFGVLALVALALVADTLLNLLAWLLTPGTS